MCDLLVDTRHQRVKPVFNPTTCLSIFRVLPKSGFMKHSKTDFIYKSNNELLYVKLVFLHRNDNRLKIGKKSNALRS